jgi:hypothetical protein
MAFVRTTDYQDQGEMPADVLNPDQDAPILMIQQLGEASDRAITVPVGETGMELPAAASRALKALAFDADGDFFMATSVGDASALEASLASRATALVGSGMIGFDATKNYAVGTIGASLSDTRLNVKMFPWLAKGDGVTDDTAAIQAAIDWVGGLTYGGTVYFPEGKYKITDTLTVADNNVALLGASQYSSQILRDTAFGESLYVGTGAADPLSNFYMGRLKFIDEGTNNQSGTQIIFEIVTVATICDIFISGGTSGIICKAIANAEFRNVYMTFINVSGSSTGNYGMLFTNTAIASPAFAISSNVYLTDCSIYGGDFGGTFSNVDDCILVECVDGLWMTGCYFRGSENAGIHLLRNSASYLLVNVYMVNNLLDIVHSYGLLIDGSQQVKQLLLDNIILGNGSPNDGIKITGPVYMVNIRGIVALWGGNGISIGATGVAMTNITIAGVTSTGNTGYGLELIADVNMNNVQVTGNDFTSNTAGSVLDGTTGITKNLEGNLGYDVPWLTYTPTIASNGGSITAVATGSYKKVGKVVNLNIRITTVSADTGTGYVTFTLPPLGNPIQTVALAAQDDAANFASVAKLTAGVATGVLLKYDGTYPSAVGRVFTITGQYEV